MHYNRHDSLTGLPDKLQFEAEVEHALKATGKPQNSFALLNVDLDQFKVICDTCGHATGKQIIAEFVENEAILECLSELGVDYAQGYGIEAPGRFPGSGGGGSHQRLSA